MQNIPKLYYTGRENKFRAMPRIRAGFEWVARGKGIATEMVDGVACAIINGRLYKRYVARPIRGVYEPDGAICCQERPDSNGRLPCWIPVKDIPEDKWIIEAYLNTPWNREDGTYEAVGAHFRGNPYGLDADFLEAHGRIRVPDFPRDFDGMKEYFRTHEIEGIVFWNGGEPKCKVKRADFGFDWPVKRTRLEETTRRIMCL